MTSLAAARLQREALRGQRQMAAARLTVLECCVHGDALVTKRPVLQALHTPTHALPREVGRIMAPKALWCKDVYILIEEPVSMLPYLAKRDFADVIRELEMGR